MASGFRSFLAWWIGGAASPPYTPVGKVSVRISNFSLNTSAISDESAYPLRISDGRVTNVVIGDLVR